MRAAAAAGTYARQEAHDTPLPNRIHFVGRNGERRSQQLHAHAHRIEHSFDTRDDGRTRAHLAEQLGTLRGEPRPGGRRRQSTPRKFVPAQHWH